MIVELARSDVETARCDFHERLSADCQGHTLDKFLNLLTLILDFMLMSIFKTNQLEA